MNYHRPRQMRPQREVSEFILIFRGRTVKCLEHLATVAMADVPKKPEPAADQDAARDAVQPSATDDVEDSVDEETADAVNAGETAPGVGKKKRRSKRKKIKDALTGGPSKDPEPGEASSSTAEGKTGGKGIDVLLKNNPALQKEMAGMPHNKIEEMLKRLNVSDLLTGMVCRTDSRPRQS